MGANGSGKSTFINLLCGFLEPNSGDIKINGKSILNLDPSQRNISTLFQENNVFNHLTVIDNINLVNKSKIDVSKIDGILKKLKILEYKYSRPNKLSGGQIQRVALAMRMVQQNEILLLDEPFSSLDIESKKDIMDLLFKIWQDNQLTIILVNHDYFLIERYTQNIIYMDKGKVLFFDDKTKFNSLTFYKN